MQTGGHVGGGEAEPHVFHQAQQPHGGAGQDQIFPGKGPGLVRSLLKVRQTQAGRQQGHARDQRQIHRQGVAAAQKAALPRQGKEPHGDGGQAVARAERQPLPSAFHPGGLAATVLYDNWYYYYATLADAKAGTNCQYQRYVVDGMEVEHVHYGKR